MIKVLHISSDIPDTVNKKKPQAVMNLINANSNIMNHIISLNRTNKLKKTYNQAHPHGEK